MKNVASYIWDEFINKCLWSENLLGIHIFMEVEGIHTYKNLNNTIENEDIM